MRTVRGRVEREDVLWDYYAAAERMLRTMAQDDVGYRLPTVRSR